MAAVPTSLFTQRHLNVLELELWQKARRSVSRPKWIVGTGRRLSRTSLQLNAPFPCELPLSLGQVTPSAVTRLEHLHGIIQHTEIFTPREPKATDAGSRQR